MSLRFCGNARRALLAAIFEIRILQRCSFARQYPQPCLLIGEGGRRCHLRTRSCHEMISWRRRVADTTYTRQTSVAATRLVLVDLLASQSFQKSCSKSNPLRDPSGVLAKPTTSTIQQSCCDLRAMPLKRLKPLAAAATVTIVLALAALLILLEGSAFLDLPYLPDDYMAEIPHTEFPRDHLAHTPFELDRRGAPQPSKALKAIGTEEPEEPARSKGRLRQKTAAAASAAHQQQQQSDASNYSNNDSASETIVSIKWDAAADNSAALDTSTMTSHPPHPTHPPTNSNDQHPAFSSPRPPCHPSPQDPSAAAAHPASARSNSTALAPSPGPAASPKPAAVPWYLVAMETAYVTLRSMLSHFVAFGFVFACWPWTKRGCLRELYLLIPRYPHLHQPACNWLWR